MKDLIYSDDDPAMDTPPKTDLKASTPFQQRLLDIYRRTKFPSADAKTVAIKIETKLEKDKLPKEYVEGIISWVEKKVENNSYIPIETMLTMIMSPMRLDTWKSRKGVTVDRPERTYDEF
jgi:hypothetical protein